MLKAGRPLITAWDVAWHYCPQCKPQLLWHPPVHFKGHVSSGHVVRDEQEFVKSEGRKQDHLKNIMLL